MQPLTILGGGPAGLGVAFYAHRAGRPFRLYERDADLGGMCRTLQHGRHRFDVGAHRFHDRDPEITSDLGALLGGELRPVRAPSQIWSRGRFIDFPPTPLGALQAFGPWGALRIALELCGSLLSRNGARNFAEHARARYGETLARELLLNYSEKLWGLPAEALSPDVATRRLQGLGLGPRRHLDGEFLYPRGGYGRIAERLAAAVPRESLRTGHEVRAVELSGGRITRVHFHDLPSAEVSGRVVSTLPLPLIARLLDDALPEPARAAASRLGFRRLRLLFLRIAAPRVSPNASIYLPEPRFCVSRLYEPKNRSPEMAPPDETSLVAEVPCSPGDALDTLADEALAARVLAELDEIGLLAPARVVEWRALVLPAAYPVYRLGYERDVRAVLDALRSITNLDPLGRAGAFAYSHLHDQLRFAKDYVASLSDPTAAAG
jgi:protoporphyrinogen oxidase